ncbi:MAG: hypothetical protein H6816_04220 [Phycisphaerales bacterium]|nr:hypothetical protein [Phycisphaerales bacterium]
MSSLPGRERDPVGVLELAPEEAIPMAARGAWVGAHTRACNEALARDLTRPDIFHYLAAAAGDAIAAPAATRSTVPVFPDLFSTRRNGVTA